MSWDEDLFELFDDLEGQAQALYAAERDEELADRSRAEYATVTLAGRLMASLGRRVVLQVAGAGPVSGELRRSGRGWCLVADATRETVVPVDAVLAAEGLSDRALPEVAWSPLARLGLGAALRRMADEGTACVVVDRAGGRYEALPIRVGEDFVEVAINGDRRLVLPMAGIGAVHSLPRLTR